MKPRQPEREFQAQVVQLAQLRRWRVAHFRNVRVQRRDGSCFYQTPVQADGAGFPDLVLVRDGRLLAVELKVPPNKTTPAQDAWLRELGAAGAACFVWTPEDWPEIEKELSGVANLAR